MQEQSEIGGAHVLLSLGTSDNKLNNNGGINGDLEQSEESIMVPGASINGENGTCVRRIHCNTTAECTNKDLRGSNSSHDADDTQDRNNNTGHTHEAENTDVHDLMDKASQSLNDAVEAAVMRYVGGSLDTGEDLAASGNGPSDSEVNELEDSSRKRARLNADDLLTDYQWEKFLEEEVGGGSERTSPRKKSRKSNAGDHDIDPDLGDFDSNVEHNQLIHAAILGARELAKHLALSGTAAQRSHYQMTSIQERRIPEQAAQPSIITPTISNIVTGLSVDYRSDKVLSVSEHRRPLKKSLVTASNTNIDPLEQESKYSIESLESLVEQASSEACMWYNAQTDLGDHRPRLFSAVEIEVVEHFLRGYCRINHLSRMDICRRVWTSERPKDNFWESVTKVLPYRSKASVYKHIRRQYHVFEVRAKWTPSEDEHLRKLTETSNTNWKDIGEAMSRMPEDCRDRWRNYIKCGSNRVMNKWSDEEEQALRSIVSEMITNEPDNNNQILINWTVVSERMNGVRSRIQCRYKWNKLLRRESLSRMAMMDPSIKLWLLNRVLESNVTDIDSIDWNYILHMYHEVHKGKNKFLWTSGDFKVAFEKLYKSVRDHKTLSLQTVVTKSINTLYQESVSVTGTSVSDGTSARKSAGAYDELRPKDFDSISAAENEATSAANAAVAAVSSAISSHDTHHQEYSLWR